MKSKGGASVYIDLDYKRLVDLIAPLCNTNLSEIINDSMIKFVDEHAPLEILDKRIASLEAELTSLKASREALFKSTGNTIISSQPVPKARPEATIRHETTTQGPINLESPEAINNLVAQIKQQTINWNTAAAEHGYDSAFDARQGILFYLLDLNKITDSDCKKV